MPTKKASWGWCVASDNGTRNAKQRTPAIKSATIRETGNTGLGFLAEQKITQAHQLAVGVEAKFDAAAAPRTYDRNVRAETCAQAGFEVELLR